MELDFIDLLEFHFTFISYDWKFLKQVFVLIRFWLVEMMTSLLCSKSNPLLQKTTSWMITRLLSQNLGKLQRCDKNLLNYRKNTIELLKKPWDIEIIFHPYFSSLYEHYSATTPPMTTFFRVKTSDCLSIMVTLWR